MKHGDQGKGKTAKAASQASANRGKSVTVLKGGKAGKNSKAAGENGKGAGKKAGGESSSAKASPEKVGRRPPLPTKAAAASRIKKDDGGKAYRGGDSGPFNNPVVGNAFKRAVAKYPNAFRKLTD